MQILQEQIAVRAVVTLPLANKRGSMALLQLIVFIMKKSCVDTYGRKEEDS